MAVRGVAFLVTTSSLIYGNSNKYKLVDEILKFNSFFCNIGCILVFSDKSRLTTDPKNKETKKEDYCNYQCYNCLYGNSVTMLVMIGLVLLIGLKKKCIN